MTAEIPETPFQLFEHAPFEPAGRRELVVFGTPVELLWLPERKARKGVPSAERPPFQACIAERILEDEAVWRQGRTILTPNRFPFAREQIVLWSQDEVREPTLEMFEIAFELEHRANGTTLVNSTGAAASITRAHLHIVSDQNPFLPSIQAETHDAPYLESLTDVEVFRLASPYPVVALGLRGTPAARARATHRLLQLRTTPAVNVVSTGGRTWILPRSSVEVPDPHFPHALGAAEFWGRWCFGDLEPFERAKAADLEAALRISGIAQH